MSTAPLTPTEQIELETRIRVLQRFAEDMAEHDCAYPHSPCLAVHISKLGHGMCVGCNARAALAKAEGRS